MQRFEDIDTLKYYRHIVTVTFQGERSWCQATEQKQIPIYE